MVLFRSSLVTVSIALGILLAGCGSSGSSSRGDEASKRPAEILADVKRDLAKVKSFHVVERERKAGQVTAVTADIMASGPARIDLRQHGSAVQIIVLPKAVYLKADASYWRRLGGPSGPALAKRFALRWVAVPASAAAGVAPMVAKLSPKHLASCVTVGLGTLTNNGVTTIAGRQAIELEDKGDRPGDAPGKLYVTADGPTLPLRQVQTGPFRPGGPHVPACESSDKDAVTGGQVTFSRFNAVATITPPRGALSLEDLGTAGSAA